MKLRDIWHLSISTFKRENPITQKFVVWYAVVLIFAVILGVAYQIIPMLLETRRLNQAIQEGRVYVQGQNPLLNPNIGDFILRDDGGITLPPFYPLRPPKKDGEAWDEAALETYWDDIDQKKLGELRRENRRMLEDALQSLP